MEFPALSRQIMGAISHDQCTAKRKNSADKHIPTQPPQPVQGRQCVLATLASCSRDLNITQPLSTHPRPRWSVNVFVALVTWSNGLTHYLVHFLNLDWWIHSHKSCQRFYPCPLMESHPRYDISWLASLECFGVVACELGEEKKSSKSGSSCHASLTLFAS